MLLNTPSVKIGWRARSFSLIDPSSSESLSFEEVKGKNGTLVAFICNHCPYVIAIVTRLVEDAKVLQSNGIGVVAINSNDYENIAADSPANMIAFSKRHRFSFPYLVDRDQSVAKAYGAVCTPDFFGINEDGVLQYRGRLDDVGMRDAESRTPELLNAMLEIKRSGNGPVDQLSSMGCSIKWKKQIA